ncbi:MAG: beta-ketoacyl synthase, partial [Acidimicrobiales bacterium]|nr:beta-ketoacyl synthase [Acidimicrobiales bacterium]
MPTGSVQGRRVAVTGLGVVASCGVGPDAFWAGLNGPPPEGERRVADWDPSPWFDKPKDARRTDRFAQFALAGAAMALEQAGSLPYDPSRIGTWIGTGVGGIATLEEQININ